MAQAGHAPVIGYHFMAPHEFNVIVNRLTNGGLLVNDINDKIMFKISPCDAMLHRQRLLQDEHGRPIAKA
ncbi:hypothetical protein R6Q59_018364 [Mikania micrantha]